MSRGIVSEPSLTALETRKKELQQALVEGNQRVSAAAQEIRDLEIKIQAVRQAPKQAAMKTISDNVEKIGELISECTKLSKEAGVPFSLEDLGYLNEDEMADRGWSDSNC